MTLGEKIQALRKQHRMSQEQLADALNISRQAVSKWETNESQPDIDRLTEISSLFNVSTDYLIMDGYSAAAAVATPIRRHRDESIFRSSRISFLVSAIYSSATIIFLLVGFIWDLWHPGWIIFLLPPIIVRLLAQFMSKSAEDLQAFEEAIEREDD